MITMKFRLRENDTLRAYQNKSGNSTETNACVAINDTN